MDVMEALRAHGEAGAAIVDLLYGDGAAEVSKALDEKQKSERLQNRVALASNIVGIGAGVVGTREAAEKLGEKRAKRRAEQGLPPKAPRGELRPVTALRGSAVGRKTGAAYGSLKAAGKARGITRTKLAVAGAGAGLGLQVANVAGDAVTNRVISRAKQREGVAKADEHDIEWFGEISKTDASKRQVFGWASVTSVDGVKVADLQGDEIELEEIEKAAYDYVMNSRKGGNMHQREGDGPRHVSDLIESLVVTPEKAQELGINGGREGWWVGFKVHDDETWAAAQKGELVGFSIHGKGKRAH